MKAYCLCFRAPLGNGPYYLVIILFCKELMHSISSFQPKDVQKWSVVKNTYPKIVTTIGLALLAYSGFARGLPTLHLPVCLLVLPTTNKTLPPQCAAVCVFDFFGEMTQQGSIRVCVPLNSFRHR